MFQTLNSRRTVVHFIKKKIKNNFNFKPVAKWKVFEFKFQTFLFQYLKNTHHVVEHWKVVSVF